MEHLHSDDVKLFRRVKKLMEAVAERYQLPLRSIIPHPDARYTSSPLGDCDTNGIIRLVLRGKLDNGTWDEEVRAELSVWNTGAHELAHLKHMNHGLQFQEFEIEMQQALKNERRREREARIEKLFKLRKQAESEASLGNEAAAEAFAATMNKLLLDWELSPTDLERREGEGDDPIVELKVDLGAHKIQPSKTRVAWQETIAHIVANAHNCRSLIKPKCNDIWFVGTKTHATIAEYVYGTLIPQIDQMSYNAYMACRKSYSRTHQSYLANGYRESWISAFCQRIYERFEEAKKAAVAAAMGDGISHSMALMRINTAKRQVDDYIDHRFRHKRKYANQLSGLKSGHAGGAAAGRAAADAIAIGRKGVHSGVGRGKLED
jgi:hypothetical protein